MLAVRGFLSYYIIVAEFYIVATPIGNLGDMTFRAVETLKSVDVVACEDTRRTLQLLNHFGIRKPLLSCRAHNEQSASEKILALLDKGQNVAYVSDAGTPSVSDPGGLTVRKARAAGHRVTPIPGASAFATLVSVSGGMDKTVIFEGFLSPKSGRRKSRVAELMKTECGFVLYESPFRIVKLLADIAEIDSKRIVIVGREMTKLHEEIISGSADDVYGIFSGREKIAGEFSVYISGKNC